VSNQTVIFSTPTGSFEQLLCHAWRWYLPVLLPALLLAFWLPLAAQPVANQARMLSEVGAWVQQTQGVTASQYSFAPMDSRVQTQSCDRALVMDLPFASRETVRVRCLGQPNWQLYLRVVFDPSAKPPSKPATETAAAPPAPLAASTPAVAMRRVVVARQLLRAGTLVTADLLAEVDHPGTGLDAQVLRSIKEAENGEMVRELPAGVPLRSYDLRRAVLIKVGQTVLLTVGQGGGFSITARVEAMQEGRMGDQVRLKNPESGRILIGVVTGPNTARGL
jgi:flagella basal body P-ring formation protein FlgA